MDKVSQLVFSRLQETQSAAETITAKHELEQFSHSHDMHIKHYRCDNGIYHAKSFKEDCRIHEQGQSFSCIGAHWQNGIAERYIGVLTRKARTMLIHAMARWPNVVDDSFWSFAFQLATHQHNHLPSWTQSNITPYERFTLQDDEFNPLSYHTFGCPTYVLDPALADRKPITKWSSHCYLGVYVGISNVHASTVALVYNHKTGLTSPAYHCIFNEDFTTVSSLFDLHATEARTQQVIKMIFTANCTWHHSDAYSHKDDTFHAVLGRRYHDYNLAHPTELRALHMRKAQLTKELRRKRHHLHYTA